MSEQQQVVVASDTSSRQREIELLRSKVAAQDAELASFRAAAATDDSWVTPAMRAYWDSIVAVPCEPEPARDYAPEVRAEIEAARIAASAYDNDPAAFWGPTGMTGEWNRAGWDDAGQGRCTTEWRSAGWLAHQIYWHGTEAAS